MLADAYQRIQATDPRQSFIVQAPAGSGKTELLTQRYLRLLNYVERPEQILAITFTKKAACEMKERIIKALERALQKIIPQSTHDKQTYAYATSALARSCALQWNLLEQPQTLRVTTIDAFCQSLTHAIPLAEQQSPYAEINSEPYALYHQAAVQCLKYSLNQASLSPHVKNLLKHLDNRQDNLLALLSDLLAKRETWLEVIYDSRQLTKAELERFLLIVQQDQRNHLLRTLTLETKAEVMDLSRTLAKLSVFEPITCLKNCYSFDDLTLEQTIALAQLLLTQNQRLRKRFDHHLGLKITSCDRNLYNELKERSQVLLENLAQNQAFCRTLVLIKSLPNPYYEPQHWLTLEALFQLLPLLVAQLHLIFFECNQVDFTAITQQALQALTSSKDLSLFLDHSIHHLLIDEFQDTSLQHYDLISKLIDDWNPDSGKTLFLVGDPMQSIYRFRQAEVGLFLKAKQQGLANLPLKFLSLCCNFRASAALVEWINHHFQTIFPKVNDIESGAVAFQPSQAIIPPLDLVIAEQYDNENLEAAAIVTLIQKLSLDHPQEKIAILVRARSQLNTIVNLLKSKQIAFQGVEIEPLKQLSHLCDLWSLIQSLLLPAERLPWLAFLRSPWVGLSLGDLERLANFDKRKSLYYALNHYHLISGLSDEATIRLRYIYHVFTYAFHIRYQLSLIDWLKEIMCHLHGHQILQNVASEHLERFWSLIEKFTTKEQTLDITHFQQEFDKLYVQSNRQSTVEVMTIHKSKGLEFDTVILPALGKSSKKNRLNLLSWLKLPHSHHSASFILSPIKAATEKTCKLSDYIRQLEEEKNHYELQRLLYVAVTRAKKRLYLFDNKLKSTAHTFRSLLPESLFSTPTSLTDNNSQISTNLPKLYRLPIDFYQKLPNLIVPSLTKLSELRVFSDSITLAVNRIIYQTLLAVLDNHLEYFAIDWQLVHHLLQRLGFDFAKQQATLTVIQKQIHEIYQHSIGQWLLKRHQDERNYYEIMALIDNEPTAQVIDRTFLFDNHRWLINFKFEPETVFNEHVAQLNYQASLFTNENKTIHCGLYYLASGYWKSWTYHLAPKALSLV